MKSFIILFALSLSYPVIASQQPQQTPTNNPIPNTNTLKITIEQAATPPASPKKDNLAKHQRRGGHGNAFSFLSPEQIKTLQIVFKKNSETKENDQPH